MRQDSPQGSSASYFGNPRIRLAIGGADLKGAQLRLILVLLALSAVIGVVLAKWFSWFGTAASSCGARAPIVNCTASAGLWRAFRDGDHRHLLDRSPDSLFGRGLRVASTRIRLRRPP
jgi:hypothetical protein